MEYKSNNMHEDYEKELKGIIAQEAVSTVKNNLEKETNIDEKDVRDSLWDELHQMKSDNFERIDFTHLYKHYETDPYNYLEDINEGFIEEVTKIAFDYYKRENNF
jgi:hypothetical protein